MEKATFAKLLKELEVPVCYRAFKKGEAPAPPYAIYYQLGKDSFNADNTPYFTSETLIVELITSQKDVALEEKLEQLLTEHRLTFEFEAENYLSSEELYQSSYFINLL